MIRSRMLVLSVAALALSLSACGTSKSTGARAAPAPAADISLQPTADATPGPTGSAAQYELFPATVPADNWEITDAARRDDPTTVDDLQEVPGLDWSAQYQDAGVEDETRAPYVMISGYTANFADVVNDVAGDGAQQTTGDINGHPAAWGTLTGADAGDTNTFVIFEPTPGHAVELDGANLPLDTLKSYAGMLQPAPEQDWVQVHADATGADESEATDDPEPDGSNTDQ
jgi:hypothetical protein